MNEAAPRGPEATRALWLGQLSRFAAVGVINTAVDLAVLNAETLVTGIRHGTGYAVQRALSFGVAVLCSFRLNQRWTFRDRSSVPRGRKLSSFVLVSIVGAVINVTTATAVATWGRAAVAPLLPGGVLTDQLWVNLAALSGTAVGFGWNFLGYKFLVFEL